MGKIDDGFQSGFSGRVGNVVGYRWRGKWCLRIRPATFHDARTESQLEQRSLFSRTVAFAGSAKRILRIGLRRASLEQGMTECNYFMRLNKGCFAMEEGCLEVDYERLVFSEGPVAPVAFNELHLEGETTLSIGFEKNPLHRSSSAEDEVYVVLYLPELRMFYMAAPVYRRSQRVEIELREEWIGKELHLWGFVQDRAGRTSATQYIGSGEMEGDEEEEVIEENPEYPEGSACSGYSEHERDEATEAEGKAAGPPGGV